MITKPMPFKEAILYLLEKDPNPSEWDSADWAMQRPSVKVRSFISAKVESARFLDRAQGMIFDFMAGTTEQVVGTDGVQRTALRVGGRADFVRQMRQFMVREGMATEKEIWSTNQGDIEDIKSEARLRLIFDTNVRQAYGYGQWRQGMSPAVRDAFPAARFIRVSDVVTPRPRHEAHLGEVRLKTDYAFWSAYINDPLIGGFGVPWGPYGFGSGTDQEDVSRDDAEQQSVIVSPQKDEVLPGMNDGMKISTKRMDPDLKKKLIEELQALRKSYATGKTPEQHGREAGARARCSTLQRGIDEAVAKGDTQDVERLKKLLDEVPDYGPKTIELREGDGSIEIIDRQG